MVGELDIDMADLAVGALTINPEREQYIDFSEPWLYHGIRILEKWVILRLAKYHATASLAQLPKPLFFAIMNVL